MCKQNETHEREEKAYLRRRRIVSLISIVGLIGVLVAVTVAFEPLLKVIENPDTLRAWLSKQGAWGYLVMIGIVCFQVVIAFIPGEVVEIAAGYAYGAIPGLICCLIGTAIGSSIVFVFTRLLGTKMVEAFISREKLNSLRFINTAEKRNLLTFILFFIPGTPKDTLTYFIGLTPMKMHTFLLISSVARIPSVVSSTLAGNALGVQRYTMAVIIFAVTGVISLIGILIYHEIVKRKK